MNFKSNRQAQGGRGVPCVPSGYPQLPTATHLPVGLGWAEIPQGQPLAHREAEGSVLRSVV